MQGPTERELLQALRTNTLAPSRFTEEMIALYECKPGEQGSENVWLHTSASVNLAFVQALYRQLRIGQPSQMLSRNCQPSRPGVCTRAVAHPSEVTVLIKATSLNILDFKNSTEWFLESLQQPENATLCPSDSLLTQATIRGPMTGHMSPKTPVTTV